MCRNPSDSAALLLFVNLIGDLFNATRTQSSHQVQGNACVRLSVSCDNHGEIQGVVAQNHGINQRILWQTGAAIKEELVGRSDDNPDVLRLTDVSFCTG